MGFWKEVGRGLIKLRIAPLFKIRCGDVRLRFYPTRVSLVLWTDAWQGRRTYAADEDLFRAYLKPDDTVIDVGANVGLLTLTAARMVGPGGRVHAIEAHPRTCGYLRGNVALNRCENVCVHNVALGDHAGTVHFSDARRDDENAVVEGGGIETPLCRLDALGGIDAAHIALLKIDVEGYEKFVLAGGKKLLSRVACVYYESWDEHFRRYDYSAAEVVGMLVEAGFQVFRPAVGVIIPVGAGHSSEKCENLVAVRDVEDFLERTGYQRG